MATKNITKKELALLEDVQKQFCKSGRMWETGYSLPRITEALASVLRNKQVRIHVPYSNFVCCGSASTIDSDVKGVMPFSKFPKEVEDCTTLFYGETKVNRRNYLPFQGCCDVYHISDLEVCGNTVDVRLSKGDNEGMFM